MLHLHSGNMYGGVETLLHTMARLRNLSPGLEPHFGLCFSGRLSREIVETGAPVHILGSVRLSRPWTVWRARRRLSHLLRSGGYHAVMCHMPWPLVVFGRTVRSAGACLAMWAHGRHDGRNWLERMAQRTPPDLAISNSRFVASSVTNLFPGVPAPVMYYPVALSDAPEAAQWRAAVRREQGIGEDQVVIIQVSRFEEWKGHLFHLQALAQLKTSERWICWMVGGPQTAAERSYFQHVQQTAQDLGIGDRVRFLGQRSDVPQLLAGADIFCQPNQGPEPFGIVFVEALWAGRPVVTTALGGALEILDESCGVPVEPGNPASLAQALERLITSPELRTRYGQAGPARARYLCDPASQLQVLGDLLRNAIRRTATS